MPSLNDLKRPAPVTSPGDRRTAPRTWIGMGVRPWLRLLHANRYAIDPGCLPWAVLIGLLAPLNSALGILQRATHGRRIDQTRIEPPPLFILGHWRSGTTWLHELLGLDARHACPSTYACLFPSHFLLTERRATRLFHASATVRRPMDDMEMGWSHPQEDEFALCNLGLPTPYHAFAFPNRPPPHPEYLDLEGVPPEALERWKRALRDFVRAVALQAGEVDGGGPRRVVLKSPAHTARVRVLRELFPGARFVHIVRNPFEVIPSTLRAWTKLYHAFGLQRPRVTDLEERVVTSYTRMTAALERARPLVAPSHFHELRYEELVAEPLERLGELYRHLELGDLGPVLPAVQAYRARTAGHRPHRHAPSPELAGRIARIAAPIIERYGYRAPAAGRPGRPAGRAARPAGTRPGAARWPDQADQ
jgi:hypothetical protein